MEQPKFCVGHVVHHAPNYNNEQYGVVVQIDSLLYAVNPDGTLNHTDNILATQVCTIGLEHTFDKYKNELSIVRDGASKEYRFGQYAYLIEGKAVYTIIAEDALLSISINTPIGYLYRINDEATAIEYRKTGSNKWEPLAERFMDEVSMAHRFNQLVGGILAFYNVIIHNHLDVIISTIDNGDHCYCKLMKHKEEYILDVICNKADFRMAVEYTDIAQAYHDFAVIDTYKQIVAEKKNANS